MLVLDKDKIHADEQTVKEKMKNFGQEAKENIGDPASRIDEPAGENHAEGNP